MKQLESNGLTVGDMFCGGGIGAIGTKLAGFDTAYAFDNNKYAVSTFNKNIHDVAVVMDANKSDLDILPYADIITAGFPCKPFSIARQAGNASASGVGLDDPRYGNLGFVTLNTVLAKKPKAFLIENVRGLVGAANKPFFDELVGAFKTEYTVTWKVVDCSDYGVPQKRMRVFIVGIRKDIGKTFEFPEGEFIDNKHTIRDAIGDLPKDPDPSVSNHGQECGIRNDEKPFVYKVPVGGNWRSLSDEDKMVFMPSVYKKNLRTGKHSGSAGALQKMCPDRPAKTILSSPKGKLTAQILHWEGHEPRRYTVRESLRLQSVPDWFEFDDSIPLMKQYERCSGIPPLVMYAFMKEIGKLTR